MSHVTTITNVPITHQVLKRLKNEKGLKFDYWVYEKAQNTSLGYGNKVMAKCLIEIPTDRYKQPIKLAIDEHSQVHYDLYNCGERAKSILDTFMQKCAMHKVIIDAQQVGLKRLASANKTEEGTLILELEV